jgi:tetratricopeptide (TPR) repeat protein
MRYRIGRARDALADLEQAERLAETAGDARLALFALFEQATALDWAADYRGSAERAARAVACAARLGDPPPETATALALGRTAWRAERAADAARLLTVAAEAAAASGDTESRIVALLMLGPALVRTGDLAGAEARFDEVVALARRVEDRLHLCAAHGNRMFLWSARKRPDLARAELREAARLARQIGHPGPERVATYNLAEDLYWSGEDDREALELARRSRFLQERYLGEEVAEDALLVARVSIACGEPDAAREALARVEERVPAPLRTPAGRLFARLVAAWLDAARPAIWSELVAEAEGQLAGDDRLEVLYWAARAADRAGDAALGRRARERATALVDEFPIWRRRIASLPAA